MYTESEYTIRERCAVRTTNIWINVSPHTRMLQTNTTYSRLFLTYVVRAMKDYIDNSTYLRRRSCVFIQSISGCRHFFLSSLLVYSTHFICLHTVCVHTMCVTHMYDVSSLFSHIFIFYRFIQFLVEFDKFLWSNDKYFKIRFATFRKFSTNWNAVYLRYQRKRKKTVF